MHLSVLWIAYYVVEMPLSVIEYWIVEIVLLLV